MKNDVTPQVNAKRNPTNFGIHIVTTTQNCANRPVRNRHKFDNIGDFNKSSDFDNTCNFGRGSEFDSTSDFGRSSDYDNTSYYFDKTSEFDSTSDLTALVTLAEAEILTAPVTLTKTMALKTQ